MMAMVPQVSEERAQVTLLVQHKRSIEDATSKRQELENMENEECKHPAVISRDERK